MKKFKNLSIRSKLLISYLGIFSILILAGFTTLYIIARAYITSQIEDNLQASTESIHNTVKTTANQSIKSHLQSVAEQGYRIAGKLQNKYSRGIISKAEAMQTAENRLREIKVSRTGYIFVWDISEAPERIPLAVHPFIQNRDVAYVDFVQKGAALKNGFMLYEWQNPDEPFPEEKAMYIMHFEPWDWIIAATSYRHEFMELIDKNELKQTIEIQPLTQHGYSFIINLKGDIIYHPQLEGNIYDLTDSDGKKIIQKMINKRSGKITYSLDYNQRGIGKPKLSIFSHIPEVDWIVASSAFTKEIYRPASFLLYAFVIITVLTLTITALLSLKLNNYLTSPLLALIEKFNSVKEGYFCTRMEITSGDEIGILGTNFNKFMERLENYNSELLNEISRRKTAEDNVNKQLEENRHQYEEIESYSQNLKLAYQELTSMSSSLAEEKEKFQATLNSIDEGVVAVDRDENIILMNPAAAELAETDLNPEEKINFHEIFNIVSDDTGESYPLKKAITDGETVSPEGNPVLVLSHGKRKFLSLSATPLANKAGEIYGSVLAMRDITERKRLDEELARTMKIESLGLFAGGIAHDFNNLLTTIMGNISLAKSLLDNESQTYEILNEAENASSRAKDLTSQMLTFSRGGAPIKETVSIKDIIQDSVSFAFRGSRSNINLNLVEDLLNVNADSGQISQVLLNLCVNAQQAMPEGGTLNVSAVNIPSSIKTGSIMQKGEQYIEIIISDTGPGIPTDYMKHIFDPYFSTKPEGKGLGLAICHSIIRQHGGWISVENNPEGGASFKIILPGVNTPVPEKEKNTNNDKPLSGRILIMDDDPFIIKTASNILHKLGFDTDPASHGEEAIEKYRAALYSSEPYLAIIMDLTIPGGMGGKEAAAEIIKINPDAKLIVSSGYSNDAAMSRFKDFGFSGALLKPYRVDDLKEVLYKIIA